MRLSRLREAKATFRRRVFCLDFSPYLFIRYHEVNHAEANMLLVTFRASPLLYFSRVLIQNYPKTTTNFHGDEYFPV